MSANEWVAYTGPRGGKGWQHTGTGEIVYGERPGDAAQPSADKPSPDKTMWHPLGAGQWQHATTGEIVRSQNPPSASGTQSILERARQPKMAPKPKEPARPKDQNEPLLSKQLDGLPDGAQVLGWTKESPPDIGMTVWTKGEDALTTQQLIQEHGAEAMQSAAKSAPAPASAEPATDRPFTPEELTSIGKVSAMFGIAPGDVGNERQLQLFLRRTARHVGFDPDAVPGGKVDKSVASAEFLKSRHPHLEGVVKMAQSHGWGGGSTRELAQRARHAGLFLIKTAVAQGYQPAGDSEQEHLAGAMQFLGRQRPDTPQQVNPIEQIMRQIMSSGKRSTWLDVALAAVGFYLGWKLVSAMRRKARRRR